MPNRSSPNSDGPNPTVTVNPVRSPPDSVATASVQRRSTDTSSFRSVVTTSNPAMDRKGSGGVAIPA